MQTPKPIVDSNLGCHSFGLLAMGMNTKTIMRLFLGKGADIAVPVDTTRDTAFTLVAATGRKTATRLFFGKWDSYQCSEQSNAQESVVVGGQS
jgi:hypothetical protein